jgi:uncharacterized membrane protein YGL010W
MADQGLQVPARAVDRLFARYAESHRHPTNRAIHWVCVPLILWSILAALWAASPLAAYGVIAAATIFYLWLSVPIAVGMLVVSLAMLLPLPLFASTQLLLGVAAAIFVLAWIGQFVGHHIEGRRPAFADEPIYLLIGPARLLALVYERLQLRY